MLAVAAMLVGGLAGAASADPPLVFAGDTAWVSAPGSVLFTDPDGARVGIGTAQPQAVLHIAREYDASLADGYAGAIRITSDVADGQNRLLIDSNEIMATKYVVPMSALPHVGPATLYLQHDGGGVLINGGLGEAQQVHVTGWGAVHIGQANGSAAGITAKLSVAGTVLAEEVVVTPDGWADDVFDPAYALRPIAELEAFVQEHRHLPGIPSEREVMRDGLSLAEFNTGLLRTVEELTLRVVEQAKALERQRDRHARELAQQHAKADARLARLEARVGELAAR
jgi:hypothetical protein